MYRLSLQELSFLWSKSVEKTSGAFSFVNQYFLTLGARSDRLWSSCVYNSRFGQSDGICIGRRAGDHELVEIQTQLYDNILISWDLKISQELSNYLTNVRATFANSKLASARLSSRWFEIGTIFRRRGSAWGGDCGTYQKINSRESILNLKCFFYLQVQHTPKLDIHPPSAVPPFAVHSAAV